MSDKPLAIPTMLTIQETSKVTGLSYDLLRSLCLSEEIVFIKSGKKYLINLEKLINYLNGEAE